MLQAFCVLCIYATVWFALVSWADHKLGGPQ